MRTWWKRSALLVVGMSMVFTMLPASANATSGTDRIYTPIDFRNDLIELEIRQVSPVTTEVLVSVGVTRGNVYLEVYCDRATEPILDRIPIGRYNSIRAAYDRKPMEAKTRVTCRYPTYSKRLIIVVATHNRKSYGEVIGDTTKTDEKENYCTKEFLGQWWKDSRDLARAVDVCQGESGGNAYAYNDNALCKREWNLDGTGGNNRDCRTRSDVSIGLFQINLLVHCKDSGAYARYSNPRYSAEVVDPDAADSCNDKFGWGEPWTNSAYAYEIWKQAGWCLWSVGKHLGYCASYNRKQADAEASKKADEAKATKNRVDSFLRRGR